MIESDLRFKEESKRIFDAWFSEDCKTDFDQFVRENASPELLADYEETRKEIAEAAAKGILI